jgi:acetylglutamate kinase
MKRKIVIKLGGSSLQNLETIEQLSHAIRGFRKQGYEVVIVHGGGPAINQELTKRKIEWKFINGQRQTTPEMMIVIEEVLAGQVNSMLVWSLNDSFILSSGLSGASDDILLCKQANSELMQVGEVTNVDVTPIEEVLKRGETPVIAPVGVGLDGTKFNINADWAAAKIAIALGAEKLIFLTDQNGILDQHKKLVRSATPRTIHKMIDDGVISGGMFTKVSAMMTALAQGVEQVQVLNASAASRLSSQPKTGTTLRESKPLIEKDVNHGRAS